MEETNTLKSNAPEAGSTQVSRKFEILNKYGIHARPAALFVKTAAKYICEIMVAKGDVEVSGKSIMGLLTLEAHHGAELTITASGVDAQEAIAAFEELFEKKFFEE